METIAANVDRILGVMVRQGFGVVDANAAYEEVTAVALGSAVMTTREHARSNREPRFEPPTRRWSQVTRITICPTWRRSSKGSLSSDDEPSATA